MDFDMGTLIFDTESRKAQNKIIIRCKDTEFCYGSIWQDEHCGTVIHFCSQVNPQQLKEVSDYTQTLEPTNG
jgi:hypothetical protein